MQSFLRGPGYVLHSHDVRYWRNQHKCLESAAITSTSSKSNPEMNRIHFPILNLGNTSALVNRFTTQDLFSKYNDGVRWHQQTPDQPSIYCFRQLDSRNGVRLGLFITSITISDSAADFRTILGQNPSIGTCNFNFVTVELRF